MCRSSDIVDRTVVQDDTETAVVGFRDNEDWRVDGAACRLDPSLFDGSNEPFEEELLLPVRDGVLTGAREVRVRFERTFETDAVVALRNSCRLLKSIGKRREETLYHVVERVH